MWCSRGCLGPPAISVACLWHASIAGGARRRGCAAAAAPAVAANVSGGSRRQARPAAKGVSVFLDGPLGQRPHGDELEAVGQDPLERAMQRRAIGDLAAQDGLDRLDAGAQTEAVRVLERDRAAHADLDALVHASWSPCTVTAHSTSALQTIAMHDHSG